MSVKDLILINQGDMVGDAEVIQGSKRKCFATTKTDVTLLLIKADYFLELLDKFPKVKKYAKK